MKLESTKHLFREVLSMLQRCTDALLINDHLLKVLIPGQSFVTTVGAKSLTPVYSLPFLISHVQVPKNFLKKLVGYQERFLLQLKRQYQISFDYDQTLINDLVY